MVCRRIWLLEFHILELALQIVIIRISLIGLAHGLSFGALHLHQVDAVVKRLFPSTGYVLAHLQVLFDLRLDFGEALRRILLVVVAGCRGLLAQGDQVAAMVLAVAVDVGYAVALLLGLVVLRAHPLRIADYPGVLALVDGVERGGLVRFTRTFSFAGEKHARADFHSSFQLLIFN